MAICPSYSDVFILLTIVSVVLIPYSFFFNYIKIIKKTYKIVWNISKFQLDFQNILSQHRAISFVCSFLIHCFVIFYHSHSSCYSLILLCNYLNVLSCEPSYPTYYINPYLLLLLHCYLLLLINCCIIFYIISNTYIHLYITFAHILKLFLF